MKNRGKHSQEKKNWLLVLSVALLRFWTVPISQLSQTPLEAPNGRPFLYLDILLDIETNNTVKYFISLAQLQMAVEDLGLQTDQDASLFHLIWT